ncbi:hypothetical protein ASPWEDRAFT_42929 [Aspergillus wentii DTO 134E9]|uniref:Aminoglycoside phosphotransferase domain-containing protein n=1 Tax=Aspergillus wentii DTO 134E9 TaxID=1073089 RepID=A0A1L9RD95_ASPWE|nr:uncharacterized protein ASPWEDRAFT_42929 [Aspergillus wentii DTO 134E9]OJJ32891.1 hypothetical protein ASPWEDRAFT_42929 [Aspergillus wentii DTO 134E9]
MDVYSDYSDSICWFEQNWIGQIIECENSTSWKIVQKLGEHETRWTQDDFEKSKFYSQSCCIFVCEDMKNSTEAIMKVRMQIPYEGSRYHSPERRASQAEPDQRGQSSREIKALDILSKAECFCTPKLRGWKHETQSCNDLVPGGFLDYTVMERLEGKTLSPWWVDSLNDDHKQKLQTAFKTSYIECLNLNFLNLDHRAQNLIWNEEKGICYIIDWESWIQANSYTDWNDDIYSMWDLELC